MEMKWNKIKNVHWSKCMYVFAWFNKWDPEKIVNLNKYCCGYSCQMLHSFVIPRAIATTTSRRQRGKKKFSILAIVFIPNRRNLKKEWNSWKLSFFTIPTIATIYRSTLKYWTVKSEHWTVASLIFFFCFLFYLINLVQSENHCQ